MGFESRLAQAFATKSVYWEVNWRGSPLLALELHLHLLQLRKVRGVNSIYHKNSIYTWEIDTNGGIKNVQLG